MPRAAEKINDVNVWEGGARFGKAKPRRAPAGIQIGLRFLLERKEATIRLPDARRDPPKF